MITNSTKQLIFLLLDGDLPVKEFEEFVYTRGDTLEQELPLDLYYDLISLNYNQKDSFKLLSDILSPHIDGEDFKIWRTKRLLTEIIEGKIDLVLASRKLRTLYFDTGENFIPIKLGLGYESVLEEVPIPKEYVQWNQEELKGKIKIVDSYREDFINDAFSFLKELDKEQNN